ncbi:phage tail protein [Blautia schinkii]|nr:phage tail protein [Blautia schinkii]
MSSIIEVKILNQKEIEKRLGNMKSKAPVVMARAINRAVTAAKTAMGKEASSKYYVTSGAVKSTVTLTRANAGNLRGVATSRDARVPLYKFKVSPKTPVKVSGRNRRSPSVYKAAVKKAGGYKPLDGNPKPFVTGFGSGHTGVFERKSSARLPISELYGPAVPQMLKSEDVFPEIEKRANEVLKNRLDHEISRLLAQ